MFVLLPRLFSYLNAPPANFPTESDVVIAEGSTVRDTAEELSRIGVVRSSLYFYIVLQIHFENDFIQAGSYRFEEPLTAQAVAEAITHGTYLTPSVKATFPEGFSVRDLSLYLPESFTNATGEDDLATHEGYLFPDTYFIKDSATLDDVIAMMEKNYETKVAPLRDRIHASGFTEEEIVILASILEREANDDDSMREVAGILKHRLRIDMPLQVDATFAYLLGKTSAQLTEDDLGLDSPYNTYTNRGLPPAPIGNPGLRAITIALEAPESENLYYLTGNDGIFYYAQTFDAHRANKARHLR